MGGLRTSAADIRHASKPSAQGLEAAGARHHLRDLLPSESGGPLGAALAAVRPLSRRSRCMPRGCSRCLCAVWRPRNRCPLLWWHGRMAVAAFCWRNQPALLQWWGGNLPGRHQLQPQQRAEPLGCSCAAIPPSRRPQAALHERQVCLDFLRPQALLQPLPDLQDEACRGKGGGGSLLAAGEQGRDPRRRRPQAPGTRFTFGATNAHPMPPNHRCVLWRWLGRPAGWSRHAGAGRSGRGLVGKPASLSEVFG